MTDQATNTKFNRPAHLVETKSLRELLGDLRKASAWLLLAAFAAFLASAFFVVKYYVGGEMHPATWTGEQWANAILGLGITAVITAAQAFLYASGYKGPAAVAATVIVVFFGLFSEISQSMEREDATVRTRSENSPVFQAALGSIKTLTSSAASISPQQQAMADATAKLQYWEGVKTDKSGSRYSRRTVERNIARYQQQADSFAQQTRLQGANHAVLLNGAIAQAKALEYDEDKHYAMIRLIKGMFGVAGIWASFLFSVIIIGTFEYAFHFVGAYVSDHRQALRLLGRDAHGELINPDEKQASSSNIPKDYGNDERGEYLKWVTPERSSNPPANIRTAQMEPSATARTAADKMEEERPEPAPSKIRDITQQRFFRLIYAEVRTRVINGTVKPTVRPVTDAVTEVIKHHTRTLGLQPALIGKPERQKIAEKILEKLADEMVLELNNERGIGKAKYRLAGRWTKPPQTEVPTSGYLA
jgi:hypothetical protein